MIEILHGEQRFHDFGCRTLINYPNIALLVKNMPLEDYNRYGRLKDTLPFVLGSADIKTRLIDGEGTFIQHGHDLGESINHLKEVISMAQNNLNNNIQGVANVMEQFSTNMSIKLIGMGLDGDQERFVLDRMEDVSERLHKILADNDTIDKDLKKAVEVLENLGEQQQSILHDVFYHNENNSGNEPADDIELF